MEMGSFTHLVFGTNGGIAKECKLSLSNIAEKLPVRTASLMPVPCLGLEHALGVPFEILRPVHTCVRGSRTPFHKIADFLDDFSVNARNVDIF